MSYISTEGVYLMYKTSSAGSYTPMIPITEFPDMWSAPDSIDVTTMSDSQSKSIKDIIKLDALEFSAFYDKDAIVDDNSNTYLSFSALMGLNSETEIYYMLAFGSTSGSKGKLTWKGTQSAGIKGGSVSAAVEVGISVYPTTQVTYSA